MHILLHCLQDVVEVSGYIIHGVIASISGMQDRHYEVGQSDPGILKHTKDIL